MAKNKYQTHVEPYLEKIRMWRSRNVEISEICKRLKVAESTFYKYQKRYPELGEAMLFGFDEAQAFAENVLFERMKSTDERISLEATKFFLTHRCGYMTESQRQNTEINRQRMENAKKTGDQTQQIIERVIGGAPNE